MYKEFCISMSEFDAPCFILNNNACSLILFRCQRIKTEFVFEYNYLEDELIV